MAVEAQVEKANAQVHQTEAVLEQARVDLGRTIIRSPVTGTVISRSVDVGQRWPPVSARQRCLPLRKT